MAGARDDTDEVAEEILDYLRDHPEAGDTLDGMAQWWIHRRRFERARETIERALERLVADGKLRRHRSVDGTVVYCAAAREDEQDPE